MSMGIRSEAMLQFDAGAIKSADKASQLEKSLKRGTEDSTDEELMDVCKSFESYMVEQVFKTMEKTVMREEEEGDYVSSFKDMMFQQYAEDAVEGQGFGIAQMLYESMKRSQ